jgi:hypothetical protein
VIKVVGKEPAVELVAGNGVVNVKLLKVLFVGVETVKVLAEDAAANIPPLLVLVVADGGVVKTTPGALVKALGIVVSCVSVNVVVDTKDPVNVVVGKLPAGMVKVEIG